MGIIMEVFMEFRLKSVLAVLFSILLCSPVQAVFVSGAKHKVYQMGTDNCWQETAKIKVFGDHHSSHAQDEKQFDEFKKSLDIYEKEGKKTLVLIEAPAYYDGKLKNNTLLSHIDYFAYHHKNDYKNVEFRFVDERGKAADLFHSLAIFFAQRSGDKKIFEKWDAELTETFKQVKYYGDPEMIKIALEQKLYSFHDNFKVPISMVLEEIVEYSKKLNTLFLRDTNNKVLRTMRDDIAVKSAAARQSLSAAIAINSKDTLVSYCLGKVIDTINNPNKWITLFKDTGLPGILTNNYNLVSEKFEASCAVIPYLYNRFFEPLYNVIAESGLWMHIIDNLSNYDCVICVCGNIHAKVLDNLFNSQGQLINYDIKSDTMVGDLPNAFISIPEDEKDDYVLPLQLVQHILKDA